MELLLTDPTTIWARAALHHLPQERRTRPPLRAHIDIGAHRARRSPPGSTPAGGVRSRGTYATGLAGEEAVARELGRRGWVILARRAKYPCGEIDIVARRGRRIVFCEVKAAGPGRIAVESSVTAQARMRIRRAAVAWIAHNRPRVARVQSYRFDVCFVHFDAAGEVTSIDHIQNAF